MEPLTFFKNFDPLIISFLGLVIYLFIILLLFRFLGKLGIYLYISIAIIGANIQVLKLSYFSFFGEPVALGTALFASIFFCTDLLSEYYGKKAARLSVGVGFGAFLIWGIISQMTLIYPPLTPELAGAEYEWTLSIHPAMETLFTLIPGFFMASLIAYFISQFLNISLFIFLKKVTKNRWLFLRNNFSTLVASLVDNAVFSFLAFVVFNPEPVALKSLLFTFILGTYFLRVFYSLLDTPFLYLSYFFRPLEVKKKN